jgi:type I restriction enzyme S subunit
MIRWKEYRVKDVAKKIGSGATPNSNNDKYYDNGIFHWINTGDFNNSDIYFGKQMITEQALNEVSVLRFYPVDTVLVAMYGASIGKIGLLKVKATVNQACCAIVPDRRLCLPRYLFYVLMNNKDSFLQKSFGGTQPNIRQTIVSNLVLYIPSLSVQQRIVDYLDEKLAKIDGRIAVLEKQQEAYARLKKSVIHQAVTCGLNPNVPLKDSGIEWIGMIPEHWNVRRIKEVGELKLGKMLDEKPKDGYSLRPYLKSKNIGWLELKLDEVEDMFFSESEMNILRLHEGDIVISEGGEVGKSAYWTGELQECYIQNSVQKLTLYKGFCSKYYLYLSFLLGQMGYYKSIVNLVSIMHLTYEKLRKVVVLCPPLSEQQAIASYLDEKCAKIDAAIENIGKQINASKRLKRALINEVITGQRAV